MIYWRFMFLDHAFGNALRAYCSFDVLDFFKLSLDTIRLTTKMHHASIHLFKSTISGRGGKHSPLYDRSHLAGPTEHLKSDCSAAGVVSVSQRTILWIFPSSMETFHTRRYLLRLHERISLPCSLNGLAG
jgi:hypothetical protein